MRVLSESWCFCNGGGKSERLKAAIFNTKSSAMAKLSSSSVSSASASSSGGEASGTGVLIHRNLLLTTHVNLPSVSVAESAEIRLHNGVPATLMPHRFFITSSVLDLTIVGLDTIEGDIVAHGQQPQYFKLCSKPNLELGNIVFLLGHAEKKELSIGEGKVVIATDNLIKLSTEGFTWSPGSAGFDSQGNLAFMICDPMKLATSPNTKSSSTSSSSSASWKKDLPMQFGIPMPIIYDWLNQHWEGSLDDLSKPKLPLMRLVSAGHRSEHSCASFTMRQVFKATEEIEGATSSSNTVSKPRDQPGQGCSATGQTSEEEKAILQPHASITHPQGIPTPEIYESPKVTANPVKKKESTQIQLLDINFPPRVSKAPITRPSQELLPGSGENCVNEAPLRISHKEEKEEHVRALLIEEKYQMKDKEAVMEEETVSTGSVGDAHSEVQSSCSPVAVSAVRDAESSDGETLYSAETAESRNYTSPREGRFQPVGRSQSCVSYNRWGPVHRNPVARRTSLEKQTSFMQPRKTYSQGAPSHKTMDYFGPTVSSIMKKRNNLEQQPQQQQQPPSRPRPTAVHSSPRWNF
ncbi:hypothetical protein BVRB_7g179720 [Beta vulgaris subsp. vulgaris]|uniref:Uncharacterized protein n=1 Tax=Beta vulgaris subsp. vulgaris TaxID=3555 RepID=A0A0J8B7L1_BETVV|nr:uncharacterized protein LOC104908918 [Beta vulgaris subsp. vulgaris]KMS96991.1 hypothetical protein BVRB_7g179720 [Beta vulgaris subsp. vulgaris]